MQTNYKSKLVSGLDPCYSSICILEQFKDTPLHPFYSCIAALYKIYNICWSIS